MPRRLLKPQEITAIAFCDRGANPEAHITIFKRDQAAPAPIAKRIEQRGDEWCVVSQDGKKTFGCHKTKKEAEEQLAAIEANKTAAPAEPAPTVMQRMLGAIGKLLGRSDDEVRKAFHEATTFGEIQDERKMDRVVSEFYSRGYDLLDAIARTLRDRDEPDQAALIRTSLSQFVSYVEGALPTWLTGETIEKIGRKMSAARLEKLKAARASLDAIIAEAEQSEDDGVNKSTAAEGTMPEPIKKNDDAQTPPATQTGGTGDGAPALEDVLKSLPPEARAQVLELKKAADKAAADAAAAAERAQKAEEIAKAERDRRELAEIRKMVEDELEYLPDCKAETLAPVIKTAREKLTAEEWQPIETLLKAANAAIRQGNLFVVRGSDGGSSDAYGKLVAKADEIRKAEPALTPAQALDKAMLQNPDLVKQYRTEKGFGKAAGAR